MRFLWHSAREVQGEVWNHEHSIRPAVCEEHACARSGNLCPSHTPPCSWLHTGQHKVAGAGAPSCLQLCPSWLQVSCPDISVPEEPLPFQMRATEQWHQSDILTGVDRAWKTSTHATGRLYCVGPFCWLLLRASGSTSLNSEVECLWLRCPDAMSGRPNGFCSQTIFIYQYKYAKLDATLLYI